MNPVVSPANAQTSTQLVTDRFQQPAGRGSVIGSKACNGVIRCGIDVERVIRIDHGALRIGTMADPGWGREGIAYGPFERRPGRLLAVHLLNGHNTSESYVTGSVPRRLARWAAGSETDPLWRRFMRYPTSRPREHVGRKLRYWWLNRKERGKEQSENLMVGWYDGVAPSQPTSGSGLVVRATGPFNGELLTSANGELVPAFRGLQNLPVHFVSVLRQRGAIHFASSAYEGATGLPCFPLFRAVGIDDHHLPDIVHAGIHQAVLGQIGFSSDTRVYETLVIDDVDLTSWYTTAAIADPLMGSAADMSNRPAERGGTWRTSGSSLQVGANGVSLAPGGGAHGDGEAVIATTGPIGLLHAVVEGLTANEAVELRWHDGSPHDSLSVRLGDHGCTLTTVRGGRTVATQTADGSFGPGRQAVQILQDGSHVTVAVEGKVVTQPGGFPFRAEASTAELGFALSGSGAVSLHHFEAHPRLVELGEAGDGFFSTGRRIPLGTTTVAEDGFGAPLGEVDGRTLTGGARWTRLLGSGRLQVEEPGRARFDATTQRPIPGRTAYTIDWSDPTFCDLELAARSPLRTREGAGERCRAGLVMWQDPDNYFAVNVYLDDFYPAASASTFFQFRGFEDIYDAVWSNLGELVRWNHPFRLRLVCDGEAFLVLIDDQPVLHRAFSDVHPATERIAINKVGVIANWEWGHDTGSTVTNFSARRR